IRPICLVTYSSTLNLIVMPAPVAITRSPVPSVTDQLVAVLQLGGDEACAQDVLEHGSHG
uniref:hypothetical protein n=1 Tax=Klebsiella aerogenes TaxID=548 RepID=UPI001954DE45